MMLWPIILQFNAHILVFWTVMWFTMAIIIALFEKHNQDYDKAYVYSEPYHRLLASQKHSRKSSKKSSKKSKKCKQSKTKKMVSVLLKCSHLISYW